MNIHIITLDDFLPDSDMRAAVAIDHDVRRSNRRRRGITIIEPLPFHVLMAASLLFGQSLDASLEHWT